jgi:hypothetical protein
MLNYWLSEYENKNIYLFIFLSMLWISALKC